ncbi:LacI family transcriptional regulator [Pokkaliibacter plantistimulans]|uniref:LacI family transcriptional regulator n=1 Tax=Pokkaliibacter plantistimulans TaxID=1635171 RepID=A0ABX5LVT1_9GAMM|nr:LacI family transcriptional regulator [Pokkaliibacter plantistimulans]
MTIPTTAPTEASVSLTEQNSEDPTTQLAARIRIERKQRQWSLDELAQRSGVSKAMISKIERGETSPTATLLGKLSGAFGLTLSTLLARTEQQGGRLRRRQDQPQWRDPETGFIRRQLSPTSDLPLDLVQVELPVGASVSYPASAFAFFRQLIWVTQGKLEFTEGETLHQLSTGDCLELGSPSDCRFFNPGTTSCEYLVVLLRQ